MGGLHRIQKFDVLLKQGSGHKNDKSELDTIESSGSNVFEYFAAHRHLLVWPSGGASVLRRGWRVRGPP
eukprot:5650468-Amphidinium_carterae.1